MFGIKIRSATEKSPVAQYMEAKRKAAGMINTYDPEYAAAYRAKQMERYGQEVDAARAMYEGAMSGETSSALAGQNLAMGRNAQQQAIAAASGSPLASRGAMFGGAQGALGVAQQGAAGRLGEVGQGRQALLESQLRQMQYGAGLEALDFQRQNMQRKARQALEDMYLKGSMQEQQLANAEADAYAGAIAGMLPMAGQGLNYLTGGGLFGGGAPAGPAGGVPIQNQEIYNWQQQFKG